MRILRSFAFFVGVPMAVGLVALHSFRSGSRPAEAMPPAKSPIEGARTYFGKASFYADRFAGRIMADGTPMRPQGDNAASKTLPLGTTALVTNLETGQTAEITIRDRGPYVKGRIVDLSPSTARKIGIDSKRGVAMVQVTPIEVAAPR